MYCLEINYVHKDAGIRLDTSEVCSSFKYRAVGISNILVGELSYLVRSIWAFSPLVPSKREKNILVLLSYFRSVSFAELVLISFYIF